MVGVIEAVPEFDLDDDVTLGCPLQQVAKTLPVLVVPLVEIVLAVFKTAIGIDFEVVIVPVAHGIADVVAAHGMQLVEMLLEIGDLKQAVVLAATK